MIKYQAGTFFGNEFLAKNASKENGNILQAVIFCETLQTGYLIKTSTYSKWGSDNKTVHGPPSRFISSLVNLHNYYVCLLPCTVCL